MNIRVNDSDAAGGGGGGDGGLPNVQRWNQAMNLATNAFLTFSQVWCSDNVLLQHAVLPLAVVVRWGIEVGGSATDVCVQFVV